MSKRVANPEKLEELDSNIIKLDSNANITNDILADAVSCNSTSFFKGGGSAYTGTAPSQDFKYGTFIVNVRGTQRYVIALSPYSQIAVNGYESGSWSGWQKLAWDSNLANLVVEIPSFSLGLLSSGAHGYVTKTVTVPTGYVAKMAVAEIQRIGLVNGTLALSCTTEANGTVYISYYAYATIAADNSGIVVKVLCVPS